MTRSILILTVLLLAPMAAVHADEPPVTGLSKPNKKRMTMTNQVQCFRETAPIRNSSGGIHFQKQLGGLFPGSEHLSELLNSNNTSLKYDAPEHPWAACLLLC